MNCASCQHSNPASARFCNDCGAPLALTCDHCAAENPPGSRFCNGCGASLEATARAAVSERDPREFTPQHLAQRILTSKSSIEGERKHVTVVFMDVVGFTTLAEPTDPERVRTIINRCIETILEQVHRFEGTVNQFTGDGVMALFGAPIALEDAPRRAVSAALAVHRALEPLRREVRESLGADFQMRVGIHSGTVVVGSIGNDLRMEYTAVGDTTNLASRLEQLATPGSVLISESMQRQVAPFFDLRDLGEVGVKGRHAAVRVFEVLAERSTRGRFEGAVSAGLTGFVGREREREGLHAALRSARDGRGQILFLVGDAGIGKSRLLYEFRRDLLKDDPQSVFWMEGRCASYGRATAFGPIADALRRAYRIGEGDDDDDAVAKIVETERRLGGELDWTLPFVRSFLSLPVGDAEAAEGFERLDASTRRSEMQRALETRLFRAAKERPLIFVIEDLHWIDTASEEILTALADSIPTSRVLLILTHRPGYQHSLGDRSYHTRVTLQALSRDEMAQMARDLLNAVDSADTLNRLIAEKAEGNPFFVEELTRSLQEQQHVRIEGERAELALGSTELSIPDRIQDIVAARIDRLEEDRKRAIQVASVIGREFVLRLLDRISEVEETVDSIVDELRALELIYQKASYPEAVFMFKHALTHDVAYESVLHGRRKELHRAVGAAIKELYSDRLPEHYEALAHHFDRAEAWEESLHFHDLAATKAAESYANHTAAEHLRAALAIADRQNGLVSRAARRAFAERLGYLYSVVSNFLAARDAYRRAGEESEDAGDQSRNFHLAAAWALWAHDYSGAQDLIAAGGKSAKASESETEGARALMTQSYYRVVTNGTREFSDEIAEQILQQTESDPHLCSMAHSMIGEASEWRADYQLAIAQQERALEIARLRRLPDLMVQSGWFLAKAACCVGDYERAHRDLRGAVELADRIGDRAWKARLLNTLGWALAETGRHDQAIELNRQSTELGEEMVKLALVAGAPEIYANAAINLAGNQIDAGDLEAATDQLASVQAALGQNDDPWMRWRYEMHVWDSLGRLHLAKGEAERVLDWTAREIASARDHGARKLEARGLELRGRAYVAMDQRELAQQTIEQALRVASAIGYPPVQWRAESLLGELARRNGATDIAEGHFARAQQRIHTLVTPTLDEAPRLGLRQLAERLRSDPLGAYR